MSFVRPEVGTFLKRWSEAIVWGLLTLLGLHALWLGLSEMAWVLILVGATLTTLGAAYTVGAILRIRLADPVPAEGVVQVDEARVAYFGPLGGAFIDMDDLNRVEITDRFWRLTASDGTQLNIPRGASGVDALPDAFTALPGYSIAASDWQRSGEPTVPADNVRTLTRETLPDRPN